MALNLSASSETRVDPGDIFPLDPNKIELGERLRPIDESWSMAIGQSMKRDGQIHPVEVRPTADGGWRLAGAGGHRVTGARLANIAIDCKAVMFDEAFSRRREAAENLFRRANDPLERAEAIAELARLHQEQAGEEEAAHRAGSAPRRLREEAEGTCATFAHVYGWADEIGAELGFSRRTVQYDLFLYRSLQPSVVHHLRKNRHQILKNGAQLRVLARLDASEQKSVTVRLLAGAKTINDAIRLSRGSNSVTRTAEDKRLSTFIGTFQRMTLTEQRGALTHLADLLPAPFKLVEDRR